MVCWPGRNQIQDWHPRRNSLPAEWRSEGRRLKSGRPELYGAKISRTFSFVFQRALGATSHSSKSQYGTGERSPVQQVLIDNPGSWRHWSTNDGLLLLRQVITRGAGILTLPTLSSPGTGRASSSAMTGWGLSGRPAV
jgi:hypothetical protein